MYEKDEIKRYKKLSQKLLYQRKKEGYYYIKWKSNSEKKLDAMRMEVLYTTADRLKTPVTTLGLALHRMEDMKTEDERKKFFEMAKRGQREVSQAVEDVLRTVRREDKGGKNDETTKN